MRGVRNRPSIANPAAEAYVGPSSGMSQLRLEGSTAVPDGGNDAAGT